MIWLLGYPGTGKTTLALNFFGDEHTLWLNSDGNTDQYPDFNSIYLQDYDPVNRTYSYDVVKKIIKSTDWLHAGITTIVIDLFENIIVDSADKKIAIPNNKKLAQEVGSYGRGISQKKLLIKEIINDLKLCPYNIVLISHQESRVIKKNDLEVETILPKGIKEGLMQDITGRCDGVFKMGADQRPVKAANGLSPIDPITNAPLTKTNYFISGAKTPDFPIGVYRMAACQNENYWADPTQLKNIGGGKDL